MLTTSFRRSVRPLAARLAARSLATDIIDAPKPLKGPAHPFNPDVGEPKVMQKDEHLFPDHVLEEEKTGFPPGLPLQRDSKLWANKDDPNQLVRRARAIIFFSAAPRLLHFSCRSRPFNPPTFLFVCSRSWRSARSSSGTTVRPSPSGLSTAAAPAARTAAGRGR